MPAETIRTLSLILDPFLGEHKFIRFTTLDPEGDDASGFVAFEDWINEGVLLVVEVPHTCARSWYRDNEPGLASRHVARPVGASPGLYADLRSSRVLSRDRIVPLGSAEPLAAALGAATVMRPPLGHVA